MTFTSLTFIVFLALMFATYWGIRRRRSQNALLVLGSYFFYGWWDYRFCALILLSSLVDFGLGAALGQTQSAARRRWLLATSLLVNLGALAFFKYFGFFAESLAELAALIGWRVGRFELAVALPVGISFYTFQTLSYTIDVYRRKLSPTRQIIDYLAYVSFFPQLVAGPIERGQRFLPQFLEPRVFDPALAKDGCRQILWGFFKKMVLADGLALIVAPLYADPSGSSGAELALATVCFGFQIYLDFSAYSDIAIGTGRLFGFRLMRNFAYPYFARSVGEFWRRWHISLSTWFRDYLYIPLGGSRVGRSRRIFNVLTTFVVSGLWHGASWNFVIWGAIHGLAMIPSILSASGERLGMTDVPGGEAFIPRASSLFRMGRTFLLVSLAWVFFRAPTLPEALTILQRIGLDTLNGAALEALGVLLWNKKRILTILALFMLIEWLQRRHDHPLHVTTQSAAVRWILYTALFWGTLLFAAPQGGQFIYFQF